MMDRKNTLPETPAAIVQRTRTQETYRWARIELLSELSLSFAEEAALASGEKAAFLLKKVEEFRRMLDIEINMTKNSSR
jgi:hypothetical protein